MTYTRPQPEPGKIVLVASLPACDFCDDGTEASYDFRTTRGPWAYGCDRHYYMHRAHPELGGGHGQLLITDDSPKEAGATDSVTEVAARIVATRIMRQAVEHAWYERTKGDLMLDAPDHDEALAEIVDKLHAYATDTIAQVSSAQHDADGNEIAEVDENELARRIAAALDIVLYGGPA